MDYRARGMFNSGTFLNCTVNVIGLSLDELLMSLRNPVETLFLVFDILL